MCERSLSPRRSGQQSLSPSIFLSFSLTLYMSLFLSLYFFLLLPLSLLRILRRKLSLASLGATKADDLSRRLSHFLSPLSSRKHSLSFSPSPHHRLVPSQAPRLSPSSSPAPNSNRFAPLRLGASVTLSLSVRPSLPPRELATAGGRGATVRAKGATRWRLARGLAYSIRDLLRLRDRPPPPVAPASPQVRATLRGARVRIFFKSRKRWILPVNTTLKRTQIFNNSVYRQKQI